MKPILMINDDSKILAEMTTLLRKSGILPIAASSGEQALTLASGYDFALIVLDLKLADMDGDVLYGKLLDSESHYSLGGAAYAQSPGSK